MTLLRGLSFLFLCMMFVYGPAFAVQGAPEGCARPGDVCPAGSPYGGGVVYAGIYAGAPVFVTPLDNGEMDWADAIRYCESLRAHGKEDWGVPAIYILEMMTANVADIGGFHKDYYWSSSENYFHGSAHVINFSDGDLSAFHKGNFERVRCVRRGG